MPWNFARELVRHGPAVHDRPATLAAGRSYCADVLRAHSENFSVASILLPRRLLPHFQAVYAYCRWSDDLADETAGGEVALQLLRWWREELLRIYEGTPRHPVMVALRETVQRFAIPMQPFLDLLSAFEQDQHQKDYASFSQLLDYCQRSANPVGQLVLHLFECATPDRIALSDEVCTGLQLANFWQDVARDAAIGRIYLPEDDRLRYGITREQLFQRRSTPAFRRLVQFEVERARGFFTRGRKLLPLIPRRLQLDIELFISGGEATLDAIAAAGFDPLAARPVVSRTEKLVLGMRALGRWLFAPMTSH